MAWTMSMANIRTGDLPAGLLLAGAGGFIVYKSLQLDYVNEFGPGPGFLPLWLGLSLLVLAATMVVLTVAQPEKDRPQKGSWTKTLRGVTTWIAFILSIALVDHLGFLFSFVLLSFFLAWVMTGRSPWMSLAVGVGSAVAFYLVFAWGLGLPLPQGPLGF